MRNRPRILLALLLAAFLGGLCWMTLRPGEPEPFYKGKPLSYWLEGFAQMSLPNPKHPEPSKGEAAEAVRQLGTNAIPTLLRLLRKEDNWMTTQLFELSVRQHFIRIHYTPPFVLNWEATRAFGTLGPEAISAVPQLMAIYDQHPPRVYRQN